MVRALHAFWAALKDVFEEFVFMALCNIIWALMSLPLLILTYIFFITPTINIIVPLLTFLLAVLPMAPATGALFHVAQRTADGRVSKMGDFFAGMREHAVASWRIMGIWMFGVMIGFVNLYFYNELTGLVGAVVLGLWFYLLVVWLSLLIYAFPLLLLQTTPSLRLLARNAFLMTLGRPVFTTTTLVLMIVILIASILMPFFLLLITGALLAQWSTRATLALIEIERQRRAAQAEADTTNALPNEEKGRRGQVRPK